VTVGYIYILSNPSIPQKLKIGYTLNDVVARAAEISRSTGVAQPFVADYWHLTIEPYQTEQLIHQDLESVRVATNREFFELDIFEAIQTVEKHIVIPEMKYNNPELEKGSRARYQRVASTCHYCGEGFSRSSSLPFCPNCGR
jgi:hypothetical protein